MDIEKLAERCMVAESCLPDAPYRTQLCKLHQEMLDELARLRGEDELATKIIDALNAENDELRLDSEMLDWLEDFVSKNDGIVLHGGGYKISENKIQYSGIGLSGTGRILRVAIDDAINGNRAMVKAERKHLDQLGGPSASGFESMRIAALEDEIASLHAEVEELRVDAERYRWLRDKVMNQNLVIAKVGTWSLDSWSGDNTDAAIDAARGKDNG